MQDPPLYGGYAVFGLSVKTDRGVPLKLAGPCRMTGLRRLQLVRRDAKTVSLQNGEQIPKMTKLRPVMHAFARQI
jgi:hypothetical protein